MDVLNFFCRTREGKKRLEERRSRLFRIAYSWSHNAALADDLVQETLTKAMQKSSQLRDQKAGDAWLFTVMSNCYRDHFRRSKPTDEFEEGDLINEQTPETETSRHQIIKHVRAAIAALVEGQRQVITLVDLEGFSYVEVAEILNVPIGTVMSRLCRARRALKERILHDSKKNTEVAESRIRRVR
ncbi:MAG: sigma-70 family RNA polymerase sigma factor [Gammaproteobacteria bacterium]|nr:MAG: sigma-70 family RNA polymerase sigma factor [Gammaproteobacteria bacterium]